MIGEFSLSAIAPLKSLEPFIMLDLPVRPIETRALSKATSFDNQCLFYIQMTSLEYLEDILIAFIVRQMNIFLRLYRYQSIIIQSLILVDSQR